MTTSVALRHELPEEGLGELSEVLEIRKYKEDRITRTLNSVVKITGHSNVLLKELFSPTWRSAVVVIRRRDGSYLYPLCFSSSVSEGTRGFKR